MHHVFARLGQIGLALLLLIGGPACSLLDEPAPATPTSLPATATPAPTATPTPGLERTRQATLIWARQEGEQTAVGQSAVTVRVQRVGGEEVRVGFDERAAGGPGQRWRAAGWLAVIMSSLLLDVDPAEYRYTFDLEGEPDGVGAGALLTVATLAALQDHPLRPETALLGAIMPDGAIGPVGGLRERIDAAATAGKKVVLIPAGQRQASAGEGKTIDLVEHGAGMGVTVREVATIAAAYEQMTGRTLPRAESAENPDLAPVFAERVRARARAWLDRYDGLKKQHEAQPEEARQIGQKAMAQAEAAAGQARTFLEQGQPAAAYQKAIDAAGQAALAVSYPETMVALANGGMSGANKILRPLKPNLKIDALLEQLRARQTGTLGEAVALADAYSNLGLAIGMTEFGEAALRLEAGGFFNSAAKAAVATLMYVYANQAAELASDSLELGAGAGSVTTIPLARLERLAELFRRAAEANLNAFDAEVLAPRAEQEGVSLDVMRTRFFYTNESYLLATAALRSSEALKGRTRGYAPTAYAMLGSGLNAHVLAAELTVEHTALAVERDDDGLVTRVGNEAALTALLDEAERQARATATGAAVQPQVNFAAAGRLREGEPRDRLDALRAYWRATLQGQLVRLLSSAPASG